MYTQKKDLLKQIQIWIDGEIDFNKSLLSDNLLNGDPKKLEAHLNAKIVGMNYLKDLIESNIN